MSPTIFILFGITGDLARNKVLPALYHLLQHGYAPKEFRIIGVSRQSVDAQDILKTLTHTIQQSDTAIDETILHRLHASLTMIKMDPQNPDEYNELTKAMDAAPGSKLYAYLSLPPQVFNDVISNLANAGLKHANLLIEKPFGYDLESAQQLIKHTARHFPESQLYRIDHYLAKEMAQAMLDYRLSQPRLQDTWNGTHISSIEVIATESIGIAGRANFYDNIGALRDVIQSHLLQLLAVTMMKLPTVHDANHIHAAKQLVLRQLDSNNIARRGQYNGYKKEVEDGQSVTETYAELTLKSNDPLWEGTDFVVKTGKSLARKYTAILVNFRNGGQVLFNIQPNEGIVTHLFNSDSALEVDSAINYPARVDAYERVLIDGLKGDQSLFATDTEVLEAWRLVQPALDAWQGNDTDLIIYEPGAGSV